MLELVAFLCGAAVMVLEMAGSRLLAPYLGTSIVVWTGLIGVILASLSLGYWLGGRLADRKPSPALLGRIIFASACTVLLVGLFSTKLLAAVSATDVSLYAAALLAAGMLFCVPSVLLGMVSPYIIRVKIALAKVDAAHSGAVIGRFSALSTIGSIVGTFLGGYVLISVMGARYIVLCVAAALMVSSLLVTLAGSAPKGRAKRVAAAFFGLLLCMAGATALNFWERRAEAAGVREMDTRYNHILVLDRNYNGVPYRFLVTDPGKSQSTVRLDTPDDLASAYSRFFALTEMYQPEPGRVLMLGGGGYAVPRRLLLDADRSPDRRPLRVDVVEIDPGMTEVARRYFFLKDDPRLRILHEDARVFLNREAKAQDTAGRYDVALLDTFNSHYGIPFHLCTVEAMRAVYDVLADDGVAAMNIIASLNGENGRLFRSIRASAGQVFPEIRVFTVSSTSPDVVQNIILLAAKGPAKAPHPLAAWEYKGELYGETRVLTDDFAPVERYAIYD